MSLTLTGHSTLDISDAYASCLILPSEENPLPKTWKKQNGRTLPQKPRERGENERGSFALVFPPSILSQHKLGVLASPVLETENSEV